MTKTNTAPAVDTTIAKSEAKLIAKYGDKIVVSSVRRAPAGSKYGNKMLVDINTTGLDGKPDGNTRTVATSDVFQVHHTEEVAEQLRKQKLADKRATKAAAKPAAPAPAKTTKAKGKAKAAPKAKTAAAAADALGL